MKAFWKFFKFHLLSDLRNRRSIFWVIIFPILLLVLLVLAFSNLGMQGSMNFNVILINESGSNFDFSNKVVQVLKSMSFPNKGAVFTLTVMDPSQKSQAIEKILYGQDDILVVIPQDFDQSIARMILLSKMGLKFFPVSLETYYVPNRASSALAQGMISGLTSQINTFFSKTLGQSIKNITVNSKILGEIMGSPSYTDFVTPGILVIASFTTGLILVAPKLSFLRYGKVLKKYSTTPMSPPSFFFGFTFSRIIIMIIQYLGLAIFAVFVMEARVDIFSIQAFLYYLFSCAVYTAMGFAIGMAVSSAVAVSALSSVVNLPLEFLAGIYFPLFNLPWYIKIFVYANPLWYATNAMREFLRVSQSPTPMWMNFFVPAIWFGVSMTFALLKKSIERA
ncbi:ABC transporter permease [Athalassotoga saccharophila]|uniref:ABC transporter permease n=1 Tax=Athalassotoga saccharophila TaxID=1441386 RepID=UPI00137B6101|nr:ABC transporter permease [Athalassotoga saccharophila]BBJ28265.1 ABC-2 type transporter [Athalassotoga saccharophila]